MSGGRQRQPRGGTHQWFHHALILVVFFGLSGTGCRQKVQIGVSPEMLYQSIESTFISGHLVDAEAKAQAACEHYATADPVWSAVFRVEMAKVLLYEGRSAEVVRLLDVRLPLNSSAESAIRQKLLLATALNRLGQAKLSDQALAQANALHPQGALKAEMMGVEGTVHVDRGNLVAAEHLLQLALEAAQQFTNSEFLQVRLWNNLGVVALKQSHFEDAMARFNHAAKLAQSIGARVVLNYPLDNLGALYYQTGDYARALQNDQLAAAEDHAEGAKLEEVQALINVGSIEEAMGDSHGARASYEKALPLAEALQSPEKLGSIHAALAYLLLPTDPVLAESHVQQMAAVAKQRQDSTEEQLEALLLEGLVQIKQRKDQEAKTQLLSVAKQANEFPWLKWKAENTLAGLYAGAEQGKKAEIWFERSIETFNRQRASVTTIQIQLPFFENGSDLYLSYVEYLIRHGKTREALRVLDRSRAEMLAEGLQQAAAGDTTRSRWAALSTKAVAARLGGTILVYCLRPQRSYLWAIDGSHERFIELAGRETIVPLLERHTQAILASKDLLAQKDSTGRALYDALVLPAQELLVPGGRVFVIGDKELSGLNFETLIPASGEPHYWIEDATITNARSLRLLAGADLLSGKHPHLPSQEKILLIGNPVYRPEEYAPLLNAAAEMTGVASHFAPAQRSVFAGAAATPETYDTSRAERYSYVHFVAHATADAMNPLDSAIILSSSAGQASPYKLYAADILKRPLEAELVTVSSCYGSGVRKYSGEGVVGLVWAFLRAGAHAVIGSMWEVSDVSTPQLMDTLYGELLRGNRADAALRTAKLAMVRQPGVFRKPLYWASFQLYAGR